MSETLSTGRELDVAVHAALGNHIMTQEEMRAEAEKVWAVQPECCRFNYGFRWIGDTDGIDEFAQNIPEYSTTPVGCQRLKEWLREHCYTVKMAIYADGTTVCGASLPASGSVLSARGDSEFEAIARLVLAVNTK